MLRKNAVNTSVKKFFPAASKIFYGAHTVCINQEVIYMRLNSGDYAPRSGSYKVVDAQGKTVNTIYIAEGETMPPTQTSGCHYEFAGEE